jgi:hypothetical protein
MNVYHVPSKNNCKNGNDGCRLFTSNKQLTFFYIEVKLRSSNFESHQKSQDANRLKQPYLISYS